MVPLSTVHKTTQPLRTTGLPAGGFAPIDRYSAPLLPVGRGTNINDGHSYVRAIGPVTGPVNTDTIVKPGVDLPDNDDNGVALDSAHFPPNDVIPDDWKRQKGLEHYDILPVPISGPTTQVVRPVQQDNYALPSPRWTAHYAPPIFRYIREFAQRFGNTELDGYLQNDGSHFSMAQSYGANRWITAPNSRTMNRNGITPRNVPTPLDDQVHSTAQTSVQGTVFNSYRNGYIPR